MPLSQTTSVTFLTLVQTAMEDKSPYSFEECIQGLQAAWLDKGLVEDEEGFRESFFRAIEDMREGDNYDDVNVWDTSNLINGLPD